MRKLKGIVIGCGAIAREHLAAVSALENVEIAAVCDISPARAEATAERFKIARWSTSYAALLEEIRPDLVHITTPPASHFAIAKDCLGAGFNVLCEKPIALDYQQFSSLKQLANEKQCMLLENQNFRFHSSIRRIQDLIRSGDLGDVLEVQVCVMLQLSGPGNPFVDRNAPHFGLQLRGGVIGDFLPHMSYVAQMFIGPVVQQKTIWKKHQINSPLPADEFRGFIRGERATAYVSFSGNAQPSGFWVRVIGSKLHAEANLYEPPRLTTRRARSGEPALMTLVDGLAESRAVFRGAVGGFWRKLAGTGSYDGLPEFIAHTYRALETQSAPPVTLDEIDDAVRLVDRFTAPECEL